MAKNKPSALLGHYRWVAKFPEAPTRHPVRKKLQEQFEGNFQAFSDRWTRLEIAHKAAKRPAAVQPAAAPVVEEVDEGTGRLMELFAEEFALVKEFRKHRESFLAWLGQQKGAVG